MKIVSSSAQTEAEIAKQTQVLENAGPEGKAVLHDIDNFVSGINDYLEAQQLLERAMDAQRRLRASTPSRGSSWARAAATRPAARSSSAACSSGSAQTKGKSVFNDLRQFKNPESPTSVDGTLQLRTAFPSRPQGSVVLDPGSFQPTPAAERSPGSPPERGQAEQRPDDRPQALERPAAR